jgi:hypothetical protein
VEVVGLKCERENEPFAPLGDVLSLLPFHFTILVPLQVEIILGSETVVLIPSSLRHLLILYIRSPHPSLDSH